MSDTRPEAVPITPSAEGASETSKLNCAADPTTLEGMCPLCGARLIEKSCKAWCEQCPYHENCADGGAR